MYRYVYMCAYVFGYIRVCMCSCICMCTRVYGSICTCTFMYVRLYVSVYVYPYLYVSIYVCICVDYLCVSGCVLLRLTSFVSTNIKEVKDCIGFLKIRSLKSFV